MVENLLLKAARDASCSGKKLYLWGAQQMAELLKKGLALCAVQIDGCCVDDRYYKDGMKMDGIQVQPLSDLRNIDEQIVLIVAFQSQEKDQYLYWKKTKAHVEALHEPNVEVVFCDPYVFSRFDHRIFYPAVFLEENRALFKDTYDALRDEKSKRAMEAFIRQKMTGDFKYFEDVIEPDQYFVNDLIDIDKISCFVDCGAYDGDTYRALMKKVSEYSSTGDRPVTYLFEADRENYDRLGKNCENDEKCHLLNLAVWDKKETLCFDNASTPQSRKVESGGKVKVEADTIDHLIARPDFIKMDIEGAELRALQGAAGKIRKFHPTLAICVYHKREDLITIPQYIKSLCPEYKFYMRLHGVYTEELVLYAVYPDD